MPTVQVNDIELYYEWRGTGEPLLLIAGFACDHLIWSQVEASLASAYRVISFDNRGVGRSSAPDSPFSIRQMAEDALGLLDAIGVSRAHVAGHSMGGLIAQELALTNPDKVRSHVLLATCAKLDERGKALIEMFGELPRLVDARASARLIMPWLYTNAFYSKPGAVDGLVKFLIECPFPPTPQGMFHQSRAISAYDSSRQLAEIRQPTLVLVGSEDILLPPKYSEELAQAIVGAELVKLPRTGHGLLIETPDAVGAAMLEFLSRQQGDG